MISRKFFIVQRIDIEIGTQIQLPRYAAIGQRGSRTISSEHIEDTKPVAVTRHGQTVGYFIPARGQNEAELAALKQAAQTLDALLTQHDVDVDAVVAEYKQKRKKARS